MSKTSLTPGPWRLVCHGQRESDGYALLSGDNKKVIASIGVTCKGANKANAHLIAASPEMYEALEMARALIYKIVPGAMWNQLEKEIAQIDTALANARGEQS